MPTTVRQDPTKKNIKFGGTEMEDMNAMLNLLSAVFSLAVGALFWLVGIVGGGKCLKRQEKKAGRV